MEIKNLELKKQQMAEEKRQFEAQAAEEKRQFEIQMAFKEKQLEEEKRQFDKQYALQKAKKSSSGSSSKKSSSSSSTKSTGSSAVKSSSTSNSFNQSVLALGKGPISSSHLADLAANGEVVIKNGTVSKTNKVSSSFDKLLSFAPYKLPK
jgi:hypothetical protein